MSYLIALGGVACTTKTTILKQLAQLPNVQVHYEDYKEISDKFTFDPSVGSLLFAAYRTQSAEAYKQDVTSVHIFDRQPMEALVYSCLHNKLNDEAVTSSFETCRDMGLLQGWKCIVFKATAGTENFVTRAMIKRDNGIDVYTDNYVSEQNRLFDEWLRVMSPLSSCTAIEMDWTKNVDYQQYKIVKHITNTIFRWDMDAAEQGFVAYWHRVPILQEKIVMIDVNNILLEANLNCYANLRKYVLDLMVGQQYSVVLLISYINKALLAHDQGFYKRNVENICKQLNIPAIALCSYKINGYRRPDVGMFNYIVDQRKTLIDLQKSFYTSNVEEEAIFANNCGLKFVMYNKNNTI